MGAFIGDALGLGPHWYYDLAEMRRDFGEWITDYTDPRPGRYHDGLKAGELSQAGFILKLMVGAQVGLSGIPSRFLDGLAEAPALCRLATALAATL
jgi:hypothetical protein